MRYLVGLILAFTLVSLIAEPAFAQTNTPIVEVFAEGVGSFINGGAWRESVPANPCTPSPTVVCPASNGPYTTANLTSSFTKVGGGVAGVRVHFTRHDAFEASYLFSPTHLSLGASGVNPTTGQSFTETGSSFTRLRLVSFNYARYFLTRKRVQPFATLGMGTSHFNGPLNASAVALGLIGGSDHYQFAGNVGGGADFILRHHLALRFELRDYLICQPRPISGIAQGIMPSAGLVYRFM